MKLSKHYDFLKDVLVLAFTTFGGPQVHLAMFINRLVHKKKYLTEEELLEIQALCSFLPGPSSTQTLIAVGYKLGGPNLAYLTLFLWIAPAVTIMTMAAFGMTYLENREIVRFIQPIGIAFIIHSGILLGKLVLKNTSNYVLMILVAAFAFYFQSPWVCPIALIVSGTITSFNYKDHPRQNKHRMIIPWANFNLFWGFLVFLALLGHFTDSMPLLLFENFYRNGSLVFGGGQVLAPMLFTEFVEFKEVIRSDDFLTGMALSQALPGPVFAFTSYLGTLAMKGHGIGQQLLGSAVGAAGIFLPGTFLIFFVYRIWGQLKQFRAIRASLDGINSASVGLTLGAAVSFLEPILVQKDWLGIGTILVTLLIIRFTKIPSFYIFLGGLAIGLIVYL
ncbi:MULTISPECIES: chromate efflux transporter [Bacteroidota]|uniref:Chromate efflux transporter n=1 Tax=Flectobacillus rivi TaxID=2984209 RepID=A0ABT6Z4J4_9BACT|nr:MULTISPECIES: chromate efflux transporter [Bacteroidota]MDI9876030.1 chromate efflux transporter [Flectobacillus rivi]MDI9882507.1 chromate efflux transporter [Flectobacillus longus]NBB27878.1 chromate efflux transporter [Cellulophaga sp. BC115SP]